MNYADVMRFWKTQQAAANAIGVTQPTISRWRHQAIPLDKQVIIEVVTGGRLKIDRKIKPRLVRAQLVPA